MKRSYNSSVAKPENSHVGKGEKNNSTLPVASPLR